MKVILNTEASEQVKSYLAGRFTLIEFKGNGPYKAVENHPDMHLFYDGRLFSDVHYPFETTVVEMLGDSYPDTVKYNLAKVGNYIICKYEQLPIPLKEHFEMKAYEIINVNQGYAKCSTAIIDDYSIITSDKGIHEKAIQNQLNSLLIRPGHIKLEGLDYGFIGGCTLSYEDVVFFSGNITQHPDYLMIKEFVEDKDKRIEHTDDELTDLGSFIII